jgi:hypothetical protein
VAQSSETDDTDPVPGLNSEVPERGVRRDPRAEKRRGCRRIHAVGDAKNVVLVDHDVRRVATEGQRLSVLFESVVGHHERAAAKLFLPVVASFAVPAGVHETTDTDRIACGEPRHRAPDTADPPDDLVPGNHGEHPVSPLVANLMNIGMADAAIEDLDQDVFGTRVPALEVERSQRGSGILGSVSA